MRIEKKIIPALYIPAHVEKRVYYNFNELPKDKQERIMEEYRKGYDWDFWSMNMADYMNEIIESEYFPGIESLDVSFSLNCCQGDGVSFTGTITQDKIEGVLSLVYDGKIPRKIKRIIPYIYEIQFNRKNSHYCHEWTVETIVVDNYNDYTHDRFLSLCREIELLVDKYRADVCKKLEKMGYKDQDYVLSPEGIESYYDGTEFDEEGNEVA